MPAPRPDRPPTEYTPPSPAPLPRVNPDFLARPRLLALLDHWSPITVLLAPSGGGKAVLAVQWSAHAREEGHDVVWLDGEVDSPDAVVSCLARLAGLDEDADRAGTLRRLRRALQARDRRLAIVVNNAEPVLAEIGDALVEIVRDCREVHLVACLRRRLDPVAKALLEAETRIVGPADLEFSVAELQQLARLHGLELETAAAEEIHDSVGGWAALLRTGLESLTDPEGRTVTRWSPRHVEWFLGVNLVPSMPASAWAALQRVALVEQPTFGAVLAATGPLDDPARIALEAIGILDPLVSTGEPIVRLPALMRDYFRHRYDADRLGPARRVHEAVAGFWLDRDDPARALVQAVAGGCWPLAVAIVDQHCWTLLAAESPTLRQCLRSVPTTEVRDHPRVELVRQLLSPGVPEPDSVGLRTKAQLVGSVPPAELLQLDPAAVTETLDLLTLLLARELARGHLADALRLADRVDLVAPALRSAGQAPSAVRRAAHQAGTARLLAGDHGAATDSFRMVVDGVTDPDLFAAAAAGSLALLAGLEGDRETSSRWLVRWRSIRSALENPRRPLDLAARLAGALENLHALDRDDTELRSLEHEIPPDHELRPLVLWLLAQHALAWGGRSRTLALLRSGRTSDARPALSPWLSTLAGAGEAELYLSQGRTAAAARVAADLDPHSPFVAIARGRLARMTGRTDEALHLLDPVLTTDHAFASARLEALVLTAWCHHGSDDAAARDALTAAVRMVRRDRLVLPFSRIPREVLVAHAGHVDDLVEVVAMLEEADVRASYAVEDELPVLTPREEAVLVQLAGDSSLDQIARDLFVSRNTIKTQTSSLYRKLGVSDRRQAVRRAYRLGLLD